jgi:hypothetical protein
MYVNKCCNFRRQKCHQEKTERILKHKYLIIKIQTNRNVKPEVMPVIRKATGSISKSFRQYESNVTE